MIVVKKSLLKEFNKSFKPKLYIYFENEHEINKAFNPAIHPRDSFGRFTDKGIMELTENERQQLLDYLEKEDYVEYNGFHVVKDKINDVLNRDYKTEIKACEILVKQGFDVYLLSENYTRGSKADAFFKKDGKRDFIEFKDTVDKITTQYNRSIEQAPNCFITVTGHYSKTQDRNLRETVKNNVNAKEVFLYVERTNPFLKIK